MNKKFSLLLTIMVIVSIAFFGFFKRGVDDTSLRKTDKNDDYKFIAVNQILMYISNNGDGSHDPRTDGSGLYWPGGVNATKTAVYEDGLIFGAKIGREFRVNGNTHRQGLQAGKILDNGTPDDPSLSKYRVFKIKKGIASLPAGPEKDALVKDWNEWPVEDGAPWNDLDGNGIYTPGVDEPKMIGDEVLWYVANDMDPARSTRTYGTLPMGLEFQTTTFGFDRTGDLGDIVFKKYTIINKGQISLRDMILGYWSDTDLGDAGDDFTGCDTVLSLGYTYNGDAVDGTYPTAPPAMGYDFFQGPIVPQLGGKAKFLGEVRDDYVNLPMTAFAFYINGNATYQDPDQGTAQGSIQFYNYLQGKVWNGQPFIDPNTNQETVFVLAGDPVGKTGWFEGEGWSGGPTPDDRRHLMASGPFTMSPGDTQEVVVGLIMAQGTDQFNSVVVLKEKDQLAQIAYDFDFDLTPPPPVPNLHTASSTRSVTLYWEDNAESYDTVDLFIKGKGFSDTTFTFQGYRIWQFSSLAGIPNAGDAKLIRTIDINDGIDIITSPIKIGGVSVDYPVIIGNDEGLQRFITLTTDLYSSLPFNDANPYYFGVTSYGYSPNSDNKVLESRAIVTEVRPGKPGIDVTTPYDVGSHVVAERTKGAGDGNIIFKVVNPEKLTGDTYNVKINGAADSLSYSLFNKTTDDTLFLNKTNLVQLKEVPRDGNTVWERFYLDTLSQNIFDGFQLIVNDFAKDSIAAGIPTKDKIRYIQEVNGPGGTVLDEPVTVWSNPAVNGKTNSTGKWLIKAKDALKTFLWQSPFSNQGLGVTNYEFRFTGTSNYYASGKTFGFTPAKNSDSLGTGTLPFEVWDIGLDLNSTDDDERLIVKIRDFYREGTGNDSTLAIPDNKWTKLANGEWEQLYVYSDKDFTYDQMPNPSGRSDLKEHKFGQLAFVGDLPEAGTVIRFTTYKPLTEGDEFEAVPQKANFNDLSNATQNIEDGISVFPNPYYGTHSLEVDKYQRFVRFIGLPSEVNVRLYNLAGVFIRRINKNDNTQYLDWDLLNSDGLPVASGMYIAYIEMPGVGEKIMKLAIIQEQQYVDRL